MKGGGSNQADSDQRGGATTVVNAQPATSESDHYHKDLDKFSNGLRGKMIDIVNNTNYFSVIWQYVGPLIGVGIGYLITNKVWDRQKQWEMKRDTVFDVVRALGELDSALLNLNVACRQPISNNEDKNAKALITMREMGEAFISCHTKFDRAKFLAAMIVGEKFYGALSDCAGEMRSIANKIIEGDSTHYINAQKSLIEKIYAVNEAGRKELNLRTHYELRRKELTTEHWRRKWRFVGRS